MNAVSMFATLSYILSRTQGYTPGIKTANILITIFLKNRIGIISSKMVENGELEVFSPCMRYLLL